MSSYAYAGDPAGSRSMDLSVRFPGEIRTVPSIDAEGLWVTVLDEEGMECEVTVKGLTWDLLEAAMADTERRGLMPHRQPSARGVLDLLLTTYLAMPHHLRPGAEWMLSTTVARVLGLSGPAADEWLAEELQERYANSGG